MLPGSDHSCAVSAELKRHTDTFSLKVLIPASAHLVITPFVFSVNMASFVFGCFEGLPLSCKLYRFGVKGSWFRANHCFQGQARSPNDQDEDQHHDHGQRTSTSPRWRGELSLDIVSLTFLWCTLPCYQGRIPKQYGLPD